jgi:hypothetical protein
MKKTLLALFALAGIATAHAQNPYPVIAIDTVQFVNDTKLSLPTVNDTSDYVSPMFKDATYRDTVRFDGIVVTNPKIYGLSANRKGAYIQRKGGGPWSGMLVLCEPVGSGAANLTDLKTQTKFYDNFIPNYNVRVTGVMRTFNGTGFYQGETQVNLIKNDPNWDNSVEQLSLTPDTLVYTEIEAKELMAGNPNSGWKQQRLTGERWEGVLVTIKNVSVYSVQISGNRTFWSVIDDFGNVLDVRDFSAYYRRDGNGDSTGLNVVDVNRFKAPPVGTRLEYIQGIVTEYQASGVTRYGICPIYPSDYKVCTSCPPIVKYVSRTPTIALATDSLKITFEITVGDTTLKDKVLYYQKPGNTTLDSLVMTAVPSFPNQYVGKVPPTNIEGVLTYWVRAEDNKNRQTFFPDPLTLGKSVYVTANGVNSIQVLQFSNTTSGSTIWDGDSLLNIDVRGIVTGKDFGSGMLTVQNGTGTNSAIFIQKGSNGTLNLWQVGDSVQITRATVGETFNTTNLYNILGSVISSGNTLPAMEMNLPMDSFALNNIHYARQYEGVLMRFDSVKVFNTNPDGPASDFGEFSIQEKNATPTIGLRVDDLSFTFKGLNKKVHAGMTLGFIQGPMYFANGNFKFIPRDRNDIDLSNLDTLAPVITLIGNQYDTIEINTPYVDLGATALDDKDGDITSAIVVTGSVDVATLGDYTLTYTATDAWGNSDSAKRYVHVKTNVGINENELLAAAISVFPSPATTEITITANGIVSLPLDIKILDILGREILTKQVKQGSVEETVNISSLNNGAYFCVISNDKGIRTIKFMVNGK